MNPVDSGRHAGQAGLAAEQRPLENREARAADRLFWGVLVGACAWFLIRRGELGLTRPVPWPDEGSFLWQALAFRDGWTLFAPELNPARQVLWMPPGFMVLEGLYFKVVPFSLDAARTLSALFVSGAFLCVGAMTRGLRAALVASVVAAALLFAPIVVVVGNVARMESLVLLLSTAGFVLLASGRTAGLAVLLVLPLVHPNGLFPCAGGVLYLLATLRDRRPASHVDRAALLAAGLAWIAYGIYAGMHLQAFIDDIGTQVRFKTMISSEDGGPSGRLRLPILVVPALALGVATVLSRRLETKIGALATLAAAFLAQSVLTAGWLYDVYAVFAVLLTTIVVVETSVAALSRSTLGPASRKAALLALGVAAALGARWVGGVPFLHRSLDRATVDRETLTPSYFTPSDYQSVSRYLTTVAMEQGSLSAQFIPDGEALLFEGERSSRLGFVQQTFYTGYFDVAIVHESVWVPTFVHDLELLNAFSMHRTKPEETVLASRDGTERFMAYRWKRDAR